MKRIITILLLMLSAGVTYAQQDAQQSQYMFNGIYINPAYAGYKETLNLHSYYRSQWTGIAGSPTSTSIAIDAIANEGNVGLALQISSDKLGAQSNYSAYANYAYRLKMNDDGSSRLAFGLGVGVQQLGINGSLLSTNDPELTPLAGSQSTIVPDARVGVYFSNNSVYAGVSADNLVSQYINLKNYSYLPQPKPHYYLTAGGLIPLSEGLMLKPSFLIKDDAAGPTSLDLNAFILFGEKIWVGASYRTGIKLYNKSYLQNDLTNLNSVVGAVEFFPVESLRIGYGYDVSVGPLKTYSGGTHEISISYFFDSEKTRMLTPRYF